MATLKSNRHEQFALSLFKGTSQKDAAIEAGYKPSSLADFVSCDADGFYIHVDSESANSAAIQGIKHRPESNENGTESVMLTSIRLHDPIRAIAELNKMDGSNTPNTI